jgi:cation transport ATPase
VPESTRTKSAKQPSAAAIQRAEKVRDQYARNVTWPIARGWTLTGAGTRVLAAFFIAGLGMQYLNLHTLLTSSTSAAAWTSAVHTKNYWSEAAWLTALLSIVIPTQAWVRTRAYVAKLPGVAPHPQQQKSEIARLIGMPAYWPPVPQGQPSWTRRVHWRIPVAVSAAYVLLWGAAEGIERWSTAIPGKYAVLAVLCPCASAAALVSASLDLVRLRHYNGWPGAPRSAKE